MGQRRPLQRASIGGFEEGDKGWATEVFGGGGGGERFLGVQLNGDATFGIKMSNYRLIDGTYSVTCPSSRAIIIG